MKRCPECRRDYYDDSLLYCLDDGSALVEGPAATSRFAAIAADGPATAIIPGREPAETAQTPAQSKERVHHSSKRNSLIAGGVGLLVLTALGVEIFFYSRQSDPNQIDTIAVMPFVNESGNADVEYLSDGMTETLINSLSQLPKLNVKARSYVFHYKGKEVSPRTIGSELNVQAILNGRLVQRGDNLTLYLSLVDAMTGDQIWGEQYDRKMGDLLSLQSETARDVSRKLGARLSGADERKLVKSYTANPEAYQLYLRGRFHTLQVTRYELQKAIPFFQRAIEIDPNYALAYAGLADAYRGLPLAGEMNPVEYFPKAKSAAQTALEIDDQLAEAHAVLGWIVYWYDWDWAAAEKHCRLAVQLDPNSSEAHVAYAHVLSSAGRHSEAIAAARRAREIEPLNVRENTLEAQFLIHAGRPDEALDRLDKVLELDPSYWFAFQFLASAYIDMGLYAEAIDAGRKGMAYYPANTRNASFTAYALARSGKESEARDILSEMLKPEEGRFVPPYNIAIVFNGLNDREQAIAWLQRGMERRDPRMTFLRSEPKWNNLRSDPRFQELIRKVGFPQ